MKGKVFLTLVVFLVHTSTIRLATGSRVPRETQRIKLYCFWGATPCRVVMLTARVMGIDLEFIPLDIILKKEQMAPEFLKMNPQHMLPTIDDNGFILWESRAIIAYFANAYGKEESLYPKDPQKRAIVDHRLNFDLGTFSMRYIDLYIPMLLNGAKYDELKAERLREALGWLNSMIDGSDYVAGDNLTIADISIAAIFTNLDALGFDFSNYENLTKWFARVKADLEPYGYQEIDYAGGQLARKFLDEN